VNSVVVVFGSFAVISHEAFWHRWHWKFHQQTDRSMGEWARPTPTHRPLASYHYLLLKMSSHIDQQCLHTT